MHRRIKLNQRRAEAGEDDAAPHTPLESEAVLSLELADDLAPVEGPRHLTCEEYCQLKGLEPGEMLAPAAARTSL